MKLTRRDNASGYHAQSGRIKTDVVVGGKDIAHDKFIPAINMSFHGDEFFLDLNHIDSPITDRVDVHVDGKVKHAAIGAGGQRFNHEFYTVDDNTLKWDMLFDSPADVPDTIRFRIKAKGLSFLKQILSAEDIAEGCEYVVPEAEGSYAVYIDGKRNGKYQTGKVCQINSPFYVDENGERSPLLDMTITPDGDNAKMLILTNTQAVTDWVNDPKRAGHVLRLDPTIGYSTAGALTFSFAGITYQWPWQSDATGGVLSIAHAHTTGTAGSLKLGIYNMTQTPNYSPSGKSLVDQVEIPVLVDGENTAPAIGGTLLPDTWYGLAWNMMGGGLRFDNGAAPTADDWYINMSYANAMTDPLGVPNYFSLNRGYSIWWDYAPAVSNAIPPGMFGRGR